MTPHEFIEKAIEGGWKGRISGQVWTGEEVSHYVEMDMHEMLLDPVAWEAVGKVEGWNQDDCVYKSDNCTKCEPRTYKSKMHRMIDALIVGKSVEDYLASL